jgi:hypothetical protein
VAAEAAWREAHGIPVVVSLSERAMADAAP